MNLNKVIFHDGTEFIIREYPVETEPCIFEKKRKIEGVLRDTIRVTVEATLEDACGHFTHNAIFVVRQYDVDEEGNVLDTFTDYDKSEYCVAGDLVDHRDGRVTAYMGKKTEKELEIEALTSTVDGLLLEVLGA